MFKRPGTLSKRITTYVVLCSAFFALISALYYMSKEHQREKRSFANFVSTLVSSKTGSIGSSLWLMDRKQVNLELEGILGIANIEYVNLEVIDDANYELGKYPLSKNIIDAEYTIGRQEEQAWRELGRLYVVATTDHINNFIFKRFIILFAVQLATALLIAAVILYLLKMMVIGKIEQMADYASNLTVDNLSKPLALKSIHGKIFAADEITDLERAINLMRSNLLIDIQKRRQIEEALNESNEKYQLLYNKNPSMYLTISDFGAIVSINEYGASLLGYTTRELVGKNVATIYANGDIDSVIYFANWQGDKTEIMHRESSFIKSDGSSFWVSEAVRLITNHMGEKQLLMVAEDISAAKKLASELQYRARHDALTGLLNRIEFEASYKELSASEDGAQHALLYIDLDQFKQVNDSCGHEGGDELLRQLAAHIKKQLRSKDIVARLGGDEFGLIINNCGLKTATKLANNLCQKISEYQFCCEGKIFRVGASMGMVLIDSNAKLNFRDALKYADSACYKAKNLGRNRVYVFKHDKLQTTEQANWQQRLEKAIANQSFQLYQQPIVDANNVERVEYYEILTRLNSGDNLSLPNAFLPAANRYRLMPQLDLTMVELLLTALNKQQYHNSALFALNIAAQSVLDPDFNASLEKLLERSQFPTSRLCFEISESTAGKQLQQVKQFIATFSRYQCKFALDNFGSGLSSFAYLKELAVDYVKIDGSLIVNLEQNQINNAIVDAINNVSGLLGKRVIAKSVEQQHTLQTLNALGVELVQGYAIKPPQPLENICSTAQRSSYATIKPT